MKSKLKNSAIRLRKKGMLYTEIATKLAVAKSTAYSWANGVALTDVQSARVAARLKTTKQRQIPRLVATKRTKRQLQELAISLRAKAVVKDAVLGEAHRQLVCAVLFWCEGEKDVSSGIRFINSDPLMVIKFLALLRESFPIDEARFRALVHLHDYHDADIQLKYWSETTGIPQSQFYKPYRKAHTGRQARAGYQGCISVRYLDAELGKLLKAIFVEYSKNA